MITLALVALPFLAALVLWSIVDFERFVLFAILGAMVLPASLTQAGGTNVAAVDLLLVVAVAAWIIANSVRSTPDPWLRGNRLFVPAVLFVCVNAASLAWSADPHATLLFTIQLIEITIVFPLLFASVPTSIRVIRKGLMLLIALTCVMAMAALAQYATHLSAATEGAYLPGLNKNALGSFVAAGLVLAYTFLISSKRAGARGALAIVMAVEVGGLAVSISRGAMIGALVAIVVVSLLLGRRRMLTLASAAVLAVVFLSVVGPGAAKKAAATTSGGYDTNVVRQYAWAGAIKKIEDRPLLGTGGQTYLDTLPQLHGLPTNDALNIFLLTWAELGIPGMAALIFLLFRFGQLMVRMRHLPDEAAVLGLAAGGVAVSLLVHFQVDVSWTRGTTSLEFAMIGLMMALTRLSRAGATSPAGVVPVAVAIDAPVPGALTPRAGV